MPTRHRRTVNLFLVLCCLSGSLFADENLLKQELLSAMQGVFSRIGNFENQPAVLADVPLPVAGKYLAA